MHIIKMTTRGRITLPADIRRKFGIKGATRILFNVDEDKKQILITPIREKTFRSPITSL
ncbi:MAG: AbrB/MazE/SpoVT family DNA-binding domain-containing protein, partial [Ignavibacteriales bacterium]|nr:AbrB/MazE/SpoVT family DNA-binding domain-containing protein [Ignavibacteriales bacterium]